MPAKYPYTPVPLSLTELIEHLRKNFPNVVNADVLKKLQIAPNNEASIINVLKFLGLLDDEEKKTSEASSLFVLHEDSEFQSKFAEIVSRAYDGLFNLHGEAAWTIEQSKLVAYFRRSDGTSEITGIRQAKTFETLAALANKRTVAVRDNSRTVMAGVARGSSKKQTTKGKKASGARMEASGNDSSEYEQRGSERPSKLHGLGLSVKIEINLPATENQDVYDKIFRSIRENLIDVE